MTSILNFWREMIFWLGLKAHPRMSLKKPSFPSDFSPPLHGKYLSASSLGFLLPKIHPPSTPPKEKKRIPTSWRFKVTFLGWLSDLFKGLSDLQLGDEKGTLNHLELAEIWLKHLNYLEVPAGCMRRSFVHQLFYTPKITRVLKVAGKKWYLVHHVFQVMALMINWMVWGPVVFIPIGSSFKRGLGFLGGPTATMYH